MKALYRKYRPSTLAEVVGQEQVTQALTNSLKQGKISHAYLFVGPRGTGKTSVARIFAHVVNDFDYQLEDDYVDIVEIDGASNRGIDNIRELREKAAIAPTRGKYKVYIIDEVHMLTKEAFNALLKTLEEPPAHVIFVMATTDAYKVPVTITSRAQTFTFRLAEPEVMLTHLKEIAEKEGIKIEEAALKIIVRRGGGSFRDSLSLLDQISTLSEETITAEAIMAAMGLPEDAKIAELFEAYLAGDVVKITTLFRDILATGVKPVTLAEEMVTQIVAKPEMGLMELLGKLTEVKEPFAEARLLVALMPEIAPALATQPVAPKEASITQPITQAGSLDWETLLAKVQTASEVVYSQLKKCHYEIKGRALSIYPRTKIVQNILQSPNNKKILLGVIGGALDVEIREPGEWLENVKNDTPLAKISAIMGGEVQNDSGGGSPF